MVYKHVAAFLIYLSVVKMPLKGEVGSHALKSHGNYTVDHRKSWKIHGIVLLNFCGNPVQRLARSLKFCIWQVSLSYFLENK